MASAPRGRNRKTCLLAIAVLCFLAVGPGRAENLTITTLAGPDESPGAIDGAGSAARFRSPAGLAVDHSGNVYVADQHSNTIRKITPAGAVSTLAGLAGVEGSANGTGSAARFYWPSGVAVDGSGIVYVADRGNNAIRKITPEGVVSTLAGGSFGHADGKGSAAQFATPCDLAVDGSGIIYVTDTINGTVRKVTPEGVVSVLAGLPMKPGHGADATGSDPRFQSFSGVAVDRSGNVYVADRSNHVIRKVTPTGMVTTLAGMAGQYNNYDYGIGSADGMGSVARFCYPSGVAVDASDNVYVADWSNHTIRKITPAGVVSTLAGLAKHMGSVDGTGADARFAGPHKVAVDQSGNVYVSDMWSLTIRKITPAGVVSTLAGPPPSPGSADGPGSAARINAAQAVALDGAGDLYVADRSHTIRKVTREGVVSTLAGLAGAEGTEDGTGSAARFREPHAIAVDGSGNVYVAERGHATIRKITPAGVVSTLAGVARSWGSADGTGSAARFAGITGVAVDGSGNVYVSDGPNFTIREITPGGSVNTLAGLAGSRGSADGTASEARFTNPEGVAVDGAGNTYVADNYSIRKITPQGMVSTIMRVEKIPWVDPEGGFHPWQAVAVDGTGNVYMADCSNSSLRKITPAGAVSVLVGLSWDTAEGTNRAAPIRVSSSFVVDGSGNVYIAGGDRILKCVPAIDDLATIDQASGPVGGKRQLDTNPKTASTWQWSEIRVPSGSSAALSSTTVRNPTFTPDVADLYVFRLVATDATGRQRISTVHLSGLSGRGKAQPSRGGDGPRDSRFNP